MRGNKLARALAPTRAKFAVLSLAVAAAAGCNDDLHLSVVQLDVGPDPARPGDRVQASVEVNILPAQRHGIYLFIDGQEHLRLSNDGAPPFPVILQLGEAEDLIETYGVGEKEVYVEVRLQSSDEIARSQTATFVLEASGGP